MSVPIVRPKPERDPKKPWHPTQVAWGGMHVEAAIPFAHKLKGDRGLLLLLAAHYCWIEYHRNSPLPTCDAELTERLEFFRSKKVTRAARARFFDYAMMAINAVSAKMVLNGQVVAKKKPEEASSILLPGRDF